MSNTDNVALNLKSLTKDDFAKLIDANTESFLARLAGKLEAEANRSETPKDEKPYRPTAGTHGRINYGSRQDESDYERASRERFWNSLGKKIRNGARV